MEEASPVPGDDRVADVVGGRAGDADVADAAADLRVFVHGKLVERTPEDQRLGQRREVHSQGQIGVGRLTALCGREWS